MFAYDVMLDMAEEELLAEIIATFGEEIIDLTDIMFDEMFDDEVMPGMVTDENDTGKVRQ